MLERLRVATRGEYDVAREIGRGGMAAVFLAHDIALNRKVAIKVVSPELLLGQGMIARFRQEAQTIARLRHPNIVTVHAIREQDGLHFLVMEYVEGWSLERMLTPGQPLSLAAVRALLSQIGSALGHAHRNGVIHRDIKPGNVLVDRDGDARVTDFGIAKVAEGSTLTNPGDPIGTPAYMSPEQCDAKPVTQASDQYSFGVLAYELLTGSRPFSGSTLTVMRCHVEKSPPPLTQFRPDCPKDLQAVVLRMLEKQPERRYPSMAEAVRALGSIPFSDRDPAQDELRSLVGTVVGEHVAPDTPVSPPIGDPPAVSAEAPTIVTNPARRRFKLGRNRLLLGGIGMVALGVILVLVFRKPSEVVGPKVVSPPPGKPNRIEVAPGGDLVAALEKIAPGGEIALTAGEYGLDRPLRVVTSVRIVGRGLDSTRISTATPDSVPIWVTLAAEHFELTDLQLTHVTTAGVPALRVEAPNAALTRLRLVGKGDRASGCAGMGPGIAIGGASQAHVVASEIRGFCSAIRVTDSAAPELSTNILTENAAGIWYQGTAGGTANQNKIFRNGDGVYVESGRPVLDENEITRNRVGVGGRVRPDLRKNKVVNNTDVNIELPPP